jgi:hypothetical protein
MADEPENFVLQYLRQIDGKRDAVREDLSTVKARLGSLAEQVAGQRREFELWRRSRE